MNVKKFEMCVAEAASRRRRQWRRREAKGAIVSPYISRREAGSYYQISLFATLRAVCAELICWPRRGRRWRRILLISEKLTHHVREQQSVVLSELRI